MGNSQLYNGEYSASELKANERRRLDRQIQRLKNQDQNLSVSEFFGP
jgi:hypothetical protein